MWDFLEDNGALIIVVLCILGNIILANLDTIYMLYVEYIKK